MWLRPLLKKAKSGVFFAGRGLALSVLGLGAAAACVHAGVDYLAPAIVEHPYFELQRVRVASDVRITDPEGLVSEAGLFRGTSLWRIDTASARRELESPGWVKRVDVRRRFPDRVSLHIYKRKPVAATIIEGRAYVVDADGVVFREEQPAAYPDLPYLVGWQSGATPAERLAMLRRLVEVLAAAEERSLRVSEIKVDEVVGKGGNERKERLVHVFPEAPRLVVTVGAKTDLSAAFDRLQIVLDNLAPGLAYVGEIDLSYADRAVVRSLSGQLGKLMTARAEPLPKLSADAVVAVDPRWRNRG